MNAKYDDSLSVELIDTTIPAGGKRGTLTAVVYRGNKLLQNADVTLVIRDATAGVFDDGDTFAYLVTDEGGMCRVGVTRHELNDVEIIAVARRDNETARNELNMTFHGAGIESTSGVVVSSAVLHDNAVADGRAVNSLNVNIKNNNVPVAGAYVILKTESASSQAVLTSPAVQKQTAADMLWCRSLTLWQKILPSRPSCLNMKQKKVLP